MQKYVITIARGFGSGGKEIAVKLGERLGIPVYEQQLPRMASEMSGISEHRSPRSWESRRPRHTG